MFKDPGKIGEAYFKFSEILEKIVFERDYRKNFRNEAAPVPSLTGMAKSLRPLYNSTSLRLAVELVRETMILDAVTEAMKEFSRRPKLPFKIGTGVVEYETPEGDKISIEAVLQPPRDPKRIQLELWKILKGSNSRIRGKSVVIDRITRYSRIQLIKAVVRALDDLFFGMEEE